MKKQSSPSTEIDRSEETELIRSTRPSICRICSEDCGILVADDGKEIRITGNPLHPLSKGFICLRGRNFGEVHCAPDRLTPPLVEKRIKLGNDII